MTRAGFFKLMAVDSRWQQSSNTDLLEFVLPKSADVVLQISFDIIFDNEIKKVSGLFR